VRLVWVEEMKWNPLKQRRPPIQFLFFFPFSLFENERDEEKKRIDGQLAAAANERFPLVWFSWLLAGRLWAEHRPAREAKEKTKENKQTKGKEETAPINQLHSMKRKVNFYFQLN